MSLEDNKALVRRVYLDGMNNRDFNVIDEAFAPGYVVHYPGMEPIRGREAAKELITEFLNAFPDIKFVIEDQLAEGDKVATRWSAQGTHLGEFAGFPAKTRSVPPSGRHVTFSATDIYHIVDGKIAEEWNTLEQLDVMQQVGLIAPSE